MLVLLGLCLSFVIIEFSLRAAGVAYAHWKEGVNKVSLNRSGTYRILCLGESTTDNQYPWQLEEILNGKGFGFKFSVIDKGRTGTVSDVIFSNLNDYLDEYAPDMVITMMGLNDRRQDVMVIKSSPGRFYTTLKSYKLIRLLLLHMQANIVTITRKPAAAEEKAAIGQLNKNSAAVDLIKAPRGIDKNKSEEYIKAGKAFSKQGMFKEADEMYLEALESYPGSGNAYISRARLFWQLGRFNEAEAAYLKASGADPKNGKIYAEMSQMLRSQGRFKEAEEICLKAVRIAPENSSVYFEAAQLYKEMGKREKAETMYLKSVDCDPANGWAYLDMARLHKERGDIDKAEEMLLKAIEANPESGWVYVGQIQLYPERGRNIAFYQKAAERDPRNIWVYIEIARLLKDEGKYPEAEAACFKADSLELKYGLGYAGWINMVRAEILEAQGRQKEARKIFQKVTELDPWNEQAYFKACQIYVQQKKYRDAAGLYQKLINTRLRKGDRHVSRSEIRCLGENELAFNEYYHPKTQYYYKKLRDELKKRRIKHVAVEYPTRRVGALKEMLGEKAGVIFIDNEKIFKNAVAKEGYNALFNDSLAEGFGHCTYRGNRLLAENIADTVIREVLGAAAKGGAVKGGSNESGKGN